MLLPAEVKLRSKILISAGIRECSGCAGMGIKTGTVTRNYTTRAQYEEEIEYPCNNCGGSGVLPPIPVVIGVDLATGSSKSATMALHSFGRLTPKQKAVWDA